MAFVPTPQIFFMWNLWEWTGRTGPNNSRTKITFSSLASPSPSLLLSLILVWCCLEGTSWFYVHTSFIVVRNILRVMHRHLGDECFPQQSAWEAFWKVTLIAPQWHQRKGKFLMVRNWTLAWEAIRSTPGASASHLSGRTRRDDYGACISKGQTKSDEGRKASV